MGNTVGSLSDLQHSIVIGTLLGDGVMRCKTNAIENVWDDPVTTVASCHGSGYSA